MSAETSSMMKILSGLPLLSAILIATPLQAQDMAKSAPLAVPLVQTVPDAKDLPYPGGTMALDIDATDVTRSAWRVTQTIPVAAGTARLTLLYPEWLPGNHAPRGPIEEVVDIHFFAGGKELTWRRDAAEVYAFHVDVPAGARAVVAKFIHSSPLSNSDGRVTMTREMLNLQWEKMSLYPAGHYVRQIRVKPVVTFPAGWTVYTALNGQSSASGKISWAETDYETLVDSPIFAGIHAKSWDLGHNVRIDVVADKPEQLAIKPVHLATYRALAEEGILAFGSSHFDRYNFLLALTDRMGGIGLEHHRSSENQMEPKNWIAWDEFDWDRNVIPHEYAHSWDGKFRRPARLWTPDYRQPMQGDLLWVYEGQTQFWGTVLAARSGVQTKQTVLDMIASAAGGYSNQPGRKWRSVQDTTFEPITSKTGTKSYDSITRSADYYRESMLVWIEADQIIREGTAGKKGLDDFAHAFFGVRDGDWGQLTYEFGDVVSALNGVHAYDWAAFLDQRLRQPGQPVPLGGIERGGYRLIWKDEPNAFDKARSADAKTTGLSHSLGVVIGKEGAVTDTTWDSPAFNAGIVPGAKLVAVNGIAYDADAIKAAITAAKGGKEPIQLLIQRGDKFMTVPVAYHGGLRYPWLERAAPGKAPTGLDLLLSPRRVIPVPPKAKVTAKKK